MYIISFFFLIRKNSTSVQIKFFFNSKEFQLLFNSLEFISFLPIRSVHFDLNDDVFIGGAPNHVIKSLPRQVKATYGFHGCVADVFFNRRVRNVFSGVHVNRSDGVKAGCSGWS